MLNGKSRPLARLLVVEEQVRLGEERRKAMSDAKTLGCLLGVIRSRLRSSNIAARRTRGDGEREQ